MHRSYCALWGVTEEELNTTPESPATTAYGAFILDTGLQGKSVHPFSVALRLTLPCRRYLAADHGAGGMPAGIRRGGSLVEERSRETGHLGEARGEPVPEVDRRLFWARLPERREARTRYDVSSGVTGALFSDEDADTIETMAVADPPSPARYREWQATWERCVRLEKGFWDMSLNLL